MFMYQPPDIERTVAVVRGPPRRPHFDRTMEHLSKGWLPASPQLLGEIRDKLSSGHYHRDPASLREDLTRDPGLFYFFVRRLPALRVDSKGSLDPLEELEKLGREECDKLFDVSESQISTHRLREISKLQALGLKQTIISSKTAEQLAPHAELNPEVAYQAVVLRQLGLNLVAWNYPDLFLRANSIQHAHKGTLDEELKKVLGATPLEISERFVSELGLSLELRNAVADKEELGATASPKYSLLQLCQISELFGRASDPEHNPGAIAAWQEALQHLEETFGPEVLRDIAEKVGESVNFYEELTRPHPRAKIAAVSAHEPPSQPRTDAFKNNMALQRCPKNVQVLFFDVYSRLQTEGVSVEAMRALVERVVPAIGFKRGCLYLLQQATSTLVPALRLGDLPLTAYRRIRLDERNMVAESFFNTVPVKEEGPGIDGKDGIHICGALESRKVLGAVYLEVAQTKDVEADRLSMLYFLAIRHALVDCLGAF